MVRPQFNNDFKSDPGAASTADEWNDDGMERAWQCVMDFTDDVAKTTKVISLAIGGGMTPERLIEKITDAEIAAFDAEAEQQS